MKKQFFVVLLVLVSVAFLVRSDLSPSSLQDAVKIKRDYAPLKPSSDQFIVEHELLVLELADCSCGNNMDSFLKDIGNYSKYQVTRLEKVARSLGLAHFTREARDAQGRLLDKGRVGFLIQRDSTEYFWDEVCEAYPQEFHCRHR